MGTHMHAHAIAAALACHAIYCGTVRQNGVTVEPCSPLWVDPATGRLLECTNPFTSCTTKTSCLIDPCAGGVVPQPMATCQPDRTTATCLTNSCGSQLTYQGVAVAPCEGLWLDNASGAPLPGCKTQSATVSSITECLEGGPEALCAVINPDGSSTGLNPCEGATCPGHPTARCVQRTCGDAVYRGTVLRPCVVYWYEPTSGNLVTCGSTATAAATAGSRRSLQQHRGAGRE
ncbi:hypothetical protein HXX76_013102 [Chlamydomonas incerta]|uniref:Uncharacterized protein n=1 Tax=Chlamydomonas incerta TaxID=51695 RepID=A0A835ST95_CHLIN|nr:hypothetical protein HXX76_013102 [Chlamydomonas incerta]|eukprot:KAG2426345.1 hypothetical protein HXX76_013102 [Chlamydomonas incerta]